MQNWIKKKTFVFNLPITDPVLKKTLISKLEKYDELLYKSDLEIKSRFAGDFVRGFAGDSVRGQICRGQRDII